MQVPSTTPLGGTRLHRRSVICLLPQPIQGSFWKGAGGWAVLPATSVTLELLALHLTTFPDLFENGCRQSP